ncbi:hypothetical protein STEG23_021462 [Scotinomys teguina]
MTTTVATDYDNIEIQQQYSDVNNRWDVDDWDNENSSARLFERSRIKALAAGSTGAVGEGGFDQVTALHRPQNCAVESREMEEHKAI